MRYMDKEKAESARRAKEDLTRLKTYQGYEKERAAKQQEMSNEFAAGMGEIKAASAARATEDLKKIKDLQAVTENYRQKHLKIHGEWERTLGNEL